MQTSSTTETTKASTPATTWAIDGSHTTATFSVRHMMIANVRGEFQNVSGTVTYDPSKLESTSVKAELDVASIHTRDAKRDGHLRSADFFDAEHYPVVTFASKALRRADKVLELVGDLTIRGTTREVTLDLEGPTPEHKDPWGNARVGVSASTTIKRSEFNMTWNAALEAGGLLVGDDVKITIDVELIKQK